MTKSNTKTVARTKRNGAVAKVNGKTAVQIIRPLTASSLKDILWETLTDLKHDNIMPQRADAIASQSREILRTIKVQLQVAGQAKRQVPQDIIEFSERR